MVARSSSWSHPWSDFQEAEENKREQRRVEVEDLLGLLEQQCDGLAGVFDGLMPEVLSPMHELCQTNTEHTRRDRAQVTEGDVDGADKGVEAMETTIVRLMDGQAKTRDKKFEAAHKRRDDQLTAVTEQLQQLQTTLGRMNPQESEEHSGAPGPRVAAPSGVPFQFEYPSYPENMSWKEKVECYHCREWGHISRECPRRGVQAGGYDPQAGYDRYRHGASGQNPQNAPRRGSACEPRWNRRRPRGCGRWRGGDDGLDPPRDPEEATETAAPEPSTRE